MYVITKDGRPRSSRLADRNEVLGQFHRLVPYSMDHAVKYEGWDVIEVPDSTWHDVESRELRATAQRLFTDHGHDDYWDDETRDACGACAINGWGETTDDGRAPLSPNYAGWARDYVQAGRPIPARYVDGFVADLTDDSNPRYVECLRRDIATFGLYGGAVQAAVQPLL